MIDVIGEKSAKGTLISQDSVRVWPHCSQVAGESTEWKTERDHTRTVLSCTTPQLEGQNAPPAACRAGDYPSVYFSLHLGVA